MGVAAMDVTSVTMTVAATHAGAALPLYDLYVYGTVYAAERRNKPRRFRLLPVIGGFIILLCFYHQDLGVLGGEPTLSSIVFLPILYLILSADCGRCLSIRFVGVITVYHS